MTERPLRGRTVIVTPAAHAHHKAVSLALGNAEASVAFVSLARLTTRERQVDEAGGHRAAVVANLADPLSVRCAFEELEERLGPAADRFP